MTGGVPSEASSRRIAPARPWSLVLFDGFFLSARVAAALPTALVQVQTHFGRKTDPELNALRLAIDQFLVFWPLIPPMLLWFFVSRKGSTIAKWLLYAFVAYMALSLLRNALKPWPGMSIAVLPLLVVVVLDLAAVVMLNRRGARAWLERKRVFGEIDSRAFD